MTAVQGAVLAGGRSARMGMDKKSVIIGNGLTMAENAGLLLRRSTGGDVLLSGPDGVPDRRGGKGPMGGLEAVLYETRFQAVLFLPCDMPFVPVDVLISMLRAFRQKTDRPSVAFFDCLEPLLAVVPVSFRERITNAIDTGHLKVGRFWMECGFTPVRVGDPSFLRDIDFPWQLSA